MLFSNSSYIVAGFRNRLLSASSKFQCVGFAKFKGSLRSEVVKYQFVKLILILNGTLDLILQRKGHIINDTDVKNSARYLLNKQKCSTGLIKSRLNLHIIC